MSIDAQANAEPTNLTVVPRQELRLQPNLADFDAFFAAEYPRLVTLLTAVCGHRGFPEPSLSVDPAGDPAGTFDPGHAITAALEGWVPKRQIRVQPELIDEETGETVPCEDQCVIRVGGIGTAGASSAPMPDDIPIMFTSVEPTAPPTPTTEPAPPTTAAPRIEVPGGEVPTVPASTKLLPGGSGL